jgi:serine protease Do
MNINQEEIMMTLCRYIVINYQEIKCLSADVRSNIRLWSKEEPLCKYINFGVPIGAPFCFMVLAFLFFNVLIIQVNASEFNPKHLYEEVSKSIVVVTGSDTKNGIRSIGSGSIVHKNGLILTNAHIIFNKENKKPFKKLFVMLKPDRVTGNFKNDTSRLYKSELLHYSRKLDLALLKITPKSVRLPPPLNLADSNFVSIGDPVIAIGHPENAGFWSLTTGTISSKINNYQHIPGKNVFQTETSLNRGNSGGPLIDENGKMVGINSMFSRVSKDGLPVVGINFSIMSNVALQWIQSLSLNFDLPKDHKITKPPIIQVASIIPVPDIETETSNVVPQSKNQDIPKVFKNTKPFKKEKYKILENDLEIMMSSMRDKIIDKKILSDRK